MVRCPCTHQPRLQPQLHLNLVLLTFALSQTPTANMGNSSSTPKDTGAKVDAAINKASAKTEKVGVSCVHACSEGWAPDLLCMPPRSSKGTAYQRSHASQLAGITASQPCTRRRTLLRVHACIDISSTDQYHASQTSPQGLLAQAMGRIRMRTRTLVLCAQPLVLLASPQNTQ